MCFFSIKSTIHVFYHFGTQEAQKKKFLAMSSFLYILKCFACILAFFYVTSSKRVKIFVFGNFIIFSNKCVINVLFLRIECYSCFFAFWYPRISITLAIHVSCNIFSFSQALLYILAFWYLTI